MYLNFVTFTLEMKNIVFFLTIKIKKTMNVNTKKKTLKQQQSWEMSQQSIVSESSYRDK